MLIRQGKVPSFYPQKSQIGEKPERNAKRAEPEVQRLMAIVKLRKNQRVWVKN
jgi:hypothetical protein